MAALGGASEARGAKVSTCQLSSLFPPLSSEPRACTVMVVILTRSVIVDVPSGATGITPLRVSEAGSE